MRAAYDAAGRVIESVDADGNAINIEYSDYGRTATVRANGILSLVRRFDATTRQRTIEDYTASLGNEPLRHTFSYDLRGNLLHYQRGQSHMHWEYDPDGNRIAFTAPSGATTRYRRNVEGALVAVERDGGKTLTFERDEVGRHTAAIVGETHYEWEYFDGFTSKHTVISKGKDPIQWQIAYSEDGLITRVVTDGENVDYEYDAANQLTGLRSSQGIHTWVYDLAGRIVEENRGDLQWRRAYNAAGQLVRSTNSRDQVITYDYDRSGRRLKEEYSNGEQRRFEWSPFGFLAGVVSTAKGTTGATVQRSSAHVDATGYLSNVDGQEIFHDPVTSSVAQVGDNDYIHAGPLTAVDGQWTEPSWRPHRHTTLTNPYDNSGAFHAAVASEDGNIPPTTSANAGFQVGRGGSLYFAGLEWLGARQFDSASRTFISPDPLDPVTGSGWAGNPYAYAGNNPLNLFDPTGLQPVTADQLDEYRKAAAPKWGTALAFAAGIGLAFVPGMQGFAAALITGAVLGGAGSIVDQACSGYPIDWKKVGADSIFGLAGGAFGFGFGKAMSWAAKTPVGQAVTRWTGDQLKKVPILQKVLPFLGSGTDDVSRAGAANADVMSGVQSASKGVRHPDFPDADNLMSDMETPVYFSETATAIGGDKATMDNFAVSQGAEHYHDVFVHGDERTGWPWSRHSKLIFHPAQVAEQIRMNPSYDDGMPLRLVQCYGGK